MNYVLHYLNLLGDECWEGFKTKEHMKDFSLRKGVVYRVLGTYFLEPVKL